MKIYKMLVMTVMVAVAFSLTACDDVPGGNADNPVVPIYPPETPDTPSEPNTPSEPETPDTPGEPEEPDTPEEPEKPDTPEEPEPVHITGVSIEADAIADGKAVLVIGATIQLAATVTPADTEEKGLAWSSSDASVATVSETGLVKAVKVGTATITVKSTENASVSDTVTVDVVDGEISVNETPVDQGKADARSKR